jgi:hypothetical protein
VKVSLLTRDTSFTIALIAWMQMGNAGDASCFNASPVVSTFDQIGGSSWGQRVPFSLGRSSLAAPPFLCQHCRVSVAPPPLTVPPFPFL